MDEERGKKHPKMSWNAVTLQPYATHPSHNMEGVIPYNLSDLK